MSLEVNGETFTPQQVIEILKSFYNDAKQVAGQFHGMTRSRKFRASWPDQYKFANSEWKTFVAATRQMYLEMIKDPKTTPEDKQKMFLALAFEAKISVGKETDNRLQVHQDSQQYVGDKRENAINEGAFGVDPDPLAVVLNSLTTRH
jgi:hypothetical protein